MFTELFSLKSVKGRWQYFQYYGKFKIFFLKPFILSIFVSVFIFVFESFLGLCDYGWYYFVHTIINNLIQSWRLVLLLIFIMFIVSLIVSIIEWYSTKKGFEKLTITKE